MRQRIHRHPVTLDFHRYWVSGLQSECLEIESPTAPQLIAASLPPGPLLGVTGREIAGRVLPLDDVISSQADQLANRLEESPSVTGRFLLFEDYFASPVADQPASSASGSLPRLAKTCRIRRPGARPGTERRTRLSPRYLELRIGEEIGMPPKKLARLVRFSRAIEQVRTAPSIDWARVAHDCGYYDQAHFNRDSLIYAGATPTEFLASRDPSSQAMLIE